MPNDIVKKVLLLFLGSLFFLLIAFLVIKRRKKMSLEVWIALLALCVFGFIGLFFVAICTAAPFVTAQ